MTGNILVSESGDILLSESGDILVTGPITNFVRFDYIFQFETQVFARTDAIIGPFFNPTNQGMLLDLWVYDLAVTGQTLPGFWFLIQSGVDVPAFDASPQLKLQLGYEVDGTPGLIVNNLDPSIGEKFSIIAGQFALTYINNWSQRNQ